MSRERLQIPGDWRGRDRALHALARATGFQTINKLADFVLYEVAQCKNSVALYHGLGAFHSTIRRVQRRPRRARA